jgi:hypothetical protein
MPYPNGNQCCSIQKTGELWTGWISFPSGTYTLSFKACGRNCCDDSGISNQLDIFLESTQIYTITPPIDVWTDYSTTFTVPSTGSYRIYFKGKWSSSDRSTAIQHVSVMTSTDTTDGTYTYDMCKNAAIDGGYKYFALQNVNNDTSMGYCAVSNDYVSSTKNGTGYMITGGTKIWSSETTDGTSASLTNQGSLTVYNSSGTSIFNTDTLRTLQTPFKHEQSISKIANFLNAPLKDVSNRENIFSPTHQIGGNARTLNGLETTPRNDELLYREGQSIRRAIENTPGMVDLIGLLGLTF